MAVHKQNLAMDYHGGDDGAILLLRIWVPRVYDDTVASCKRYCSGPCHVLLLVLLLPGECLQAPRKQAQP